MTSHDLLRFAGALRNDFACLVAQPYHFLPLLTFGDERRANGHLNRSAAEHPGVRGQHMAGAAKGNRDDGQPGIYGGFERAQTKWEQPFGSPVLPDVY